MKSIYTATLLILSVFSAFGQVRSNGSSKNKPFVIGETVELKSKILDEIRVLNIYLPPDYNPKDTARYHTIYLLDGSADEDFIHVVGLVQFNTFPWIKQLPRTIVVGIANIDRKRDFTFPTTLKEDKELLKTSGRSEPFMAFIEKELQPFVDSVYKTDRNKTIIGQSLGGLLTTEILLKKPHLFNRYVIVSPSIWWDNGSLLKLQSEVLNERYPLQTAVYIGVGKEGLAPCSTPHVMEVDANLLAEKLKSAKSKNLSVYFDYLPEEDHATISHQAVLNAFRRLFKK